MRELTLKKFEDIETFNDETDALIVGYGIAGACAALEARALGGDVLVIERSSGGGGASALSSGIFYLGGGTGVQTACGYKDSPQNMYRFMSASMGTENADKIRRYCDDNVEHFNWLEAQGVPFERSCYKDKAVFLLTTEGLLSTGNEKLWPFNQSAQPVPRGHQVTGEGESTGNAAMTPLISRCEEAGVKTSFDTQLCGLIVDTGGRVRGVTALQLGEQRHFLAHRGVVLACGSFSMNKDMVEKHLKNISPTAEPLGIPYNDGSGIVAGQLAGAGLEAMDAYIATASIYPPGQLIKGIIVNIKGQRFVVDDRPNGATHDRPNGAIF